MFPVSTRSTCGRTTAGEGRGLGHGGFKEAVTIRRCEHVRVINCDIADWGRLGTQRFDRDLIAVTDNPKMFE